MIRNLLNHLEIRLSKRIDLRIVTIDRMTYSSALEVKDYERIIQMVSVLVYLVCQVFITVKQRRHVAFLPRQVRSVSGYGRVEFQKSRKRFICQVVSRLLGFTITKLPAILYVSPVCQAAVFLSRIW